MRANLNCTLYQRIEESLANLMFLCIGSFTSLAAARTNRQQPDNHLRNGALPYATRHKLFPGASRKHERGQHATHVGERNVGHCMGEATPEAGLAAGMGGARPAGPRHARVLSAVRAECPRIEPPCRCELREPSHSGNVVVVTR